MLLLMGVCLTVVQKSIGRKLSVELGGELTVIPAKCINLTMCTTRSQASSSSVYTGGSSDDTSLGTLAALHTSGNGVHSNRPISHTVEYDLHMLYMYALSCGVRNRTNEMS